MDLDLTSDQELFLETTERFLTANWSSASVRKLIGDPSGFDRDLWARGAELGWTSMLVPEDAGGGSISGHGICDLAIVAEEMGRHLFAGPVLPSNVVAWALARPGLEPVAKKHLPTIAAGQELAVWAVSEEGEGWLAESGSLDAIRTDTGFRLNGVKSPVQDAHVADQILVAVRTAAGVTQFLVPANAPGVSIEVLEGLDLARRFGRIVFEGVEVPVEAVIGGVDQAGADLDLQFALAVAMQCAETVGATERVYEMTLQYVKDRKSFGRPIGSYQALKHRLADMLLWLESAKAVTVAAEKAIQFESDAINAASLAKTYVADRCPVIVRECLQLHGGIGYTWEHDLHLYMRRVESNAAIYGGVTYHRDRLAPTIGL